MSYKVYKTLDGIYIILIHLDRKKTLLNKRLYSGLLHRSASQKYV